MQGGQGDDILRPGAPSQASGTVGGPDEVIGDNGQANEFGFDLIDLSDWPATRRARRSTSQPSLTRWWPSTRTHPSRPGSRSKVPSAQATTTPSSGRTTQRGRTSEPIRRQQLADRRLGQRPVQRHGRQRPNRRRLDPSRYADRQICRRRLRPLALGSAQWLADAMQTGGTGAGYDNNTENGYTGASNRATGAIQNMACSTTPRSAPRCSTSTSPTCCSRACSRTWCSATAARTARRTR